MGTEDWVLKGTKLITNTKKQRLKIQRLDFQKYKIKGKKSHKNYKIYIYMKFALKIGKVMLHVIKMKIKGVIQDLKIKKKIKQ